MAQLFENGDTEFGIQETANVEPERARTASIHSRSSGAALTRSSACTMTWSATTKQIPTTAPQRHTDCREKWADNTLSSAVTTIALASSIGAATSGNWCFRYM